MEVTKKCFSCGKLTTVIVDEDMYEAWISGANIIRCFPQMNSFDREVLISGMCYDCQSKTFNMPKPGEDWGEQVCDCPECGCRIFPKDINNGVMMCPSCHFRENV